MSVPRLISTVKYLSSIERICIPIPRNTPNVSRKTINRVITFRPVKTRPLRLESTITDHTTVAGNTPSMTLISKLRIFPSLAQCTITPNRPFQTPPLFKQEKALKMVPPKQIKIVLIKMREGRVGTTLGLRLSPSKLSLKFKSC